MSECPMCEAGVPVRIPPRQVKIPARDVNGNPVEIVLSGRAATQYMELMSGLGIDTRPGKHPVAQFVEPEPKTAAL